MRVAGSDGLAALFFVTSGRQGIKIRFLVIDYFVERKYWNLKIACIIIISYQKIKTYIRGNTMPENIIHLKHFNNLKASGLALLCDFLQSFFNCTVRLQLVEVKKFEKHFGLDIHTNINRNCYQISENKIAVIIKVFGKSKGDILAVMPIVLTGENISNIENHLFEELEILKSKKMTECYMNSFHNGTRIFGDELSRDFISVCLASRQYDNSRILFLIELFEKLSATTFEGHHFTTGLILSKSLYEYNAKNGKDRKGKLCKLTRKCDLVKEPSVNKRFWYLMDGVSSFYITNQKLVINDTFTRNESNSSLNYFFDSYFLENTLYGLDIAFRVIGPNEISIITNKGYEFIKIENKWRIRDFKSLNTYLDSKLKMNEEVRKAIIYYATLCSRNHYSSIMWIPADETETAIDNVISSKNKIWKNDLSLVEDRNSSIIQRILSSDGVTIISKSGNLIYCGAIVKLNVKEKDGLMGTGENAAKILSKNGIALKISQDGNIKIFAESSSEPLVY